jgi:signal transduction histidine kinase
MATLMAMPSERAWSPRSGALVAALIGFLAVATGALAFADRVSPAINPLAGLTPELSTAVVSTAGLVGLLTLGATCGLVIWRQPRNLFGWVMTATVVTLGIGSVADAYAVYGLAVHPGSLPFADLAAYSQKVLPDAVTVGAIAAILLFPDGRLKSSRWSIVIAAALIAAAVDVLSGLDDPFPIDVGIGGRQPVPITVPPALWPVGVAFDWASSAFIWLSGAGVVAGAGVIMRMARARGSTRRQLEWFAYAAVVYVIAALLGQVQGLRSLDWLPAFVYQPLQTFAQSDAAAGIAAWGGFATLVAGSILVPIAIGIAMVRYRLYDIDVVVNRTILFAGLAIFVTGSYALVVAGVGSLLGQRAGSNLLLNVITIAVVAALLLPVRARLQALADIAVYGRGARPYDVLSGFVRDVGRAEPASLLLPRMAELLREGTRSAASEVWVKVDERLHLAASDPTTGTRPLVVDTTDEIMSRLGEACRLAPVYRDGKLLGALAVVKPRGEHLNRVEGRLLDDLASQAGIVFERFRLVQELRESRARIVAAQDAERRRIERNLHDGAQQRFVNALLALGMAGAEEPAGSSSASLLAQASEEVQAGLSELRGLARGLNPPLLVEGGIAAAARSLADRSPLVTTVDCASDKRYPEAIESAAYYVIAEALTNAVKHSGANTVAVRIGEANGQLEVEIVDDGAGGADARRGTGLVGLNDRTAAVGGRLLVDSPAGGGTRVRAELPCA